RPQYEECLERQFDIEERQFDRALQQQIAVGHGTRRNGEVKQREEIAEPQAVADTGRVDDRCAQGIEIGRLRCQPLRWWRPPAERVLVPRSGLMRGSLPLPPAQHASRPPPRPQRAAIYELQPYQKADRVLKGRT